MEPPRAFGTLCVLDAHGQNEALKPSDRLKFAPPAAGSRYQNWNFHVLPARIAPGPAFAGGSVKSICRVRSPNESAVVGGFTRKTPPVPPTQRKPLPKGS